MKQNEKDKFRKTMTFICNTTWILIKQYGFTQSEGMKRAWQILRLKKSFKKCLVQFAFKKKDGSLRLALLSKIF